ncbi:9666_t:CDS:2 [Paraglomus occultum]|uniref:9666_t:CDS:1 n=1 Tax=Paraglomus occultum TaxID=144539 RepID=A0A9N8ZSM7_9GLOM|nr:9666_t:CDS:2 [Paraglomus occultum]
MASANRTLTLFAVLIALLVTLAVSKPIPELDERTPPVLTLLPQPSTWDLQTTQTTAWSCPQCSTSELVKLVVICNKNSVYTTTATNAFSGQANIQVDPSWAVKGYTCFIQISLVNAPSISATSSSAITIN